MIKSKIVKYLLNVMRFSKNDLENKLIVPAT